jgi:hypothetical protein
MLRRIFGPTKEDVEGGWKRLCNEYLHSTYNLPSITRMIKSRRKRAAGHVARMGCMINAYKILVGKPDVKRPLRRPRHRWDDNIRMNVREIGWEGVDWIHLAQGRDQWQTLVNMVINFPFS